MSWQELEVYKHNQMKFYHDTYGLETFVETGTNDGRSVEFARHIFKEVYSIELHAERYEYCKNKFLGVNNVHLYQGDSEILLPQIVKNLPNERILFWLDAHLGSDDPGPLSSAKHKFSGHYELEYLLNRKLTHSVILVDDIINTDLYSDHKCEENVCPCVNGILRLSPQAKVEMSIARVVLD